MGSSRGGSWSLDLFVRGGEPTTTVMVYGRGEGADDVELFGTVSDDRAPGVGRPVSIRLSAEDVGRLALEPNDGELVFLADGEPTKATVKALTTTPAVEGRYEIYSGLVDKGTGHVVEFVAITDPVEVVIVGGAVLVAGCAVLAGVAFALQKMEARSSGFNEKCRASGGAPVVVPQFGLRFSIRKLEFGCTVQPLLRCLRPDGTIISTELGPVEGLDQ